MISYAVLGVLVVATLARLCWSAFSGQGRQSRLGWIVSAAETIVVMIMARLLISWSVIPPLLWLVPIMVIAVVVVLVIHRWPAMPWLRTDRKPAVTVSRSAVGIAFLAAVGALLLS